MKDYNISIKAMLGILLMIVSVFGRAEIVTVTYVHADHLGSPTLLVDESGSVVHQMQYSPFGAHQGSPEIATGYTGHLEDEAAELTYMGARWYDHEVGRFLSSDPVRFFPDNPLSFNRYIYSNNSPYRYVDPDGELLLEAVAVISVVALLGFSDYANAPGPGDELRSRSQLEIGGAMVVPPLARATAMAAVGAMARGAKELGPTLIRQNPRNLIPTQTKAEMSGSQVKRLTRDMRRRGFDQNRPVDVWRNPNTGKLEIQDGHHRVEAARRAGLYDIPVRVWE